MKQNRLAEKIKNLRTERAWSQAQLAVVSSLSIRTVQRVEMDGKCSHESLLAFASAFDIDVQELTDLITNENSSNVKYSLSLFGFNINWLKSRTAFIVGLMMILPAVYFISASILKYNFGLSFLFDPLEMLFSSYEMLRIFNLISPVIFLFGLFGALLTNLLTMFSVKLWKEKSTIQSEISFNPRALNLLVSVISFSAMMIMFAYAIGENFIIR